MEYSDIEGWFDFEELYFQMVAKAPVNARFVEVGSWLGKSSAYMALKIKGSGKNIRFDCIDVWEFVSDEPFYHKDIQRLGDIYFIFLDNMNKTNSLDIVKPIKLGSVKASKLYDNNSLDFVFIDANHTYEFVRKDIEAWLPKIKVGGYIGGHDYNSCEGVKRAVDEAFGGNKSIVAGTSIQSWLVEVK
jgi:cephalosporin hydroxylase